MKKQKNNLPEASLILEGSVDSEMTTGVFQYIFQQVSEGNTRIPHTFYLNSGGGDGYQGLQIYGLMRSAPFKINVHVTGLCNSAAIAVLLGGSYRFSTPESSFLIHYGEDGQSSLSDLKNNIRHYKNWEQLFAKHTKATKKIIAKWHNSETYFTPQQALACGLIDEIRSPW